MYLRVHETRGGLKIVPQCFKVICDNYIFENKEKKMMVLLVITACKQSSCSNINKIKGIF